MLDLDQIESSLVGKTFIRKVYYFREMDSTNSFAKQVTEDSALVVTDYQKKGRGRLERSWLSESELNLTFTIKKHFDVGFKDIQSVNFFTSLCVALSLRKFISVYDPDSTAQISIKWPNDILLNGSKLSGTLIENSTMKNDFTIGIGVNVNQVDFPEELSRKATSLKLHLGNVIDCTSLLIDIIGCFDENMYLMNNHNFGKIFQLWRQNTDLIGKKVTFTTVGNVERTAQIIDFQQDGGIKLFTENKEIVYYSGDIKLTDLNAP